MAFKRRHLDAEVFHPFDRSIFHRGGYADSSESLYVAVTSNGHEAGALAPDHAAEQCQVHDPLHVLDSVLMVSDAHGPAKDGSPRLRIEACDFFDLSALHSRRLFDFLPS